MQRILLLGARGFNFQDDNNKTISGGKITFLTGNRLSGLDQKGLECCADVSISREEFDKLVNTPGFYDVEYAVQTKNGQMTMRISRLNYSHPADFAPVLAQASQEAPGRVPVTSGR